MQIAIIGAGNVGGALGRGWFKAGHTIRFGVTDPANERHAATAAAAGHAMVGTAADAVAGADVIALAVPWDAIKAAVTSCGDLRGRVVIDVTNPLGMGAHGLELVVGFDRSGGEIVAGLATGASVFKAMNQVGFEVMPDTTGYRVAPVMFVAGDDQTSKPAVIGLVGDLGFEAIDAGPLRVARLLEPFAMLWIHMAMNRGTPPDNAFAFMRRETT